MVSVLFVDDDIGALTALRKTCTDRCHGWEPTVAQDARAALAMMDKATFDAVVAGTQMAEMDGALFLELTKRRHPEIARIALSSPLNPGAAMRCLPVAHQCLTKPCDPELLARTIERASELQALLQSPATRRMIGEVGSLPSLPANLVALDAALSSEESSLGEVARIVGRDVAMSAKILHLVNSAFFGLRTEIRDLRQAVAYVGVEMLRNLTLVTEVFRVFTPSALLPDDWMARFNDHSLEVADIAGRLVRTSTAQYQASVAGMLHGVGELVVADRAPDKLCAVLAEVSAGRSPDEAETDHIGATYPVIAGCLLSLWGMSYRIVDAVTRQRDHWDGPHREPELVDILHVADALASADTEPNTDIPSLGAHSVDDDEPLALRDAELDGCEADEGPTGDLEEPPEESRDSQTVPGTPERARICQASQLTDLSEDYLECVGLLGAVRMSRHVRASYRPSATSGAR
jgi:HD-like signal output (HDOD) protein/CheY-like chemotaxis protein